MRESDEQAAQEAAQAAARAAVAAYTPVEVPPAETASAPHGDPLSHVAASHPASTEAVTPQPVAEPEAESDEARAAREAREAEEQAALQRERERRSARLVELAADAEAAVADENLPSARKRFSVVRREWSDVAPGLEVDPEVLVRRLGNPRLDLVFPGYTGYQPLGVVTGTDLPVGEPVFGDGFETGDLRHWTVTP